MTTASKSRYLCSELVKVEWQDKTGAFDATGILEEIWVDGACVQTIGPMQPGINPPFAVTARFQPKQAGPRR